MPIEKKFRDRINTDHPYVHSSKTNLAKTFDRIRAQQKLEAIETKNVRPIRKVAK